MLKMKNEKNKIQLVKCHQSYDVNNLKHATIHYNLDKRSMELIYRLKNTDIAKLL